MSAVEAGRYDELISALRGGDERAAREVFDANVGPLIALAQARLSRQLKRKLDAEDIVQSAFRSFFRRVQGGQFVFDEAGDLWRLLSTITLNKLREKFEHYSAQKRSVAREQSQLERHSEVDADLVDSGPSPEYDLLMDEAIGSLMQPLSEIQRSIVGLRLLGHPIDEIAAEVERSERTVRRLLEKVRRHLEDQASEL
jgi:RNA polymerase sigma-70 factor (ECF subfamily)